MPSLSQAIERLYDLNVGTTPLAEGAPHERPHKPLLLLAVFDLLDVGLATPDGVPWSQELRDRFKERFEIVRKHNDQCNPDLPFRYLAGDGFWQAVEADGATPLRRSPLVADSGKVFARFIDGFEILAAIPESRLRMREALVSRYFPLHAVDLLPAGKPVPLQSNVSMIQDAPAEAGRSSGFRRKVIEIYDHQCAACGLRIRLSEPFDVSFIDAAHLMPFSESRNDHPTNGMALCKNHHWAMDRKLIAPCPDLRWRVASVLDSRRSTGEADLLALSGRPVLLPRDEAFHPDPAFLRWRCERVG